MIFGRSRAAQASTVAQPRQIQTRTQLLNHLVRSFGYQRYLEIGVRKAADNFAGIDVPVKHGVDPEASCTYRMTSDAFFTQVQPSLAPATYDLVFIDGLHLAEQVERDVENALRCLAPNGSVVLHDVNPLSEAAQSESYTRGRTWNGTVWKAWAKLRSTREDLAMCVVDIDHGCGVIRPGRQHCYKLPVGTLSYQTLAAQRKPLLNLLSVPDYLDWLVDTDRLRLAP